MIRRPHRWLAPLIGLVTIVASTATSPIVSAAPPDTPPDTADGATTGVTRVELQRIPAPAAGFEIVQTRVGIPVGMESGMHSHPGPEVGYIVAGTVDMIFDDQPVQHLQPGDPFHIPTGAVHNARNVGMVPTLMLSSYVIDTSQPLVTLR